MHLENIHQAKTHLSKLIAQAINGEEVIICKSGQPLVKLVPVEQKSKKRNPGLLKGQIKISDDFNVFPKKLLSFFKEEKE